MERLTPQRRRARTRRALLDAGVTVFSREGYHGASLDEVADAAGYSKGAIYDHFGSKDDFFVAVLEHRGQQWMDRFAPVVGQATLGWEELLGQVATVLEDLRPGPEAARLDAEAFLYAQRDDEARERVAAVQRRRLDRIASFVRQGLAATDVTLTMDPDRVAALLTATMSGLTTLMLTDPAAGHDELFDVVFRMVADLARPVR